MFLTVNPRHTRDPCGTPRLVTSRDGSPSFGLVSSESGKNPITVTGDGRGSGLTLTVGQDPGTLSCLGVRSFCPWNLYVFLLLGFLWCYFLTTLPLLFLESRSSSGDPVTPHPPSGLLESPSLSTFLHVSK